jgi:hypothetical protein
MSDPLPVAKIQRLAAVSEAFTPSAPLDDLEVFHGRGDQMLKCLDAFFEKGQHIALYGERGVGKTSLARVLPQWIRQTKHPEVDGVRVDCNTSDDFDSIWRKIFRELRGSLDVGDPLHGLEPEDVRYSLQQIGGFKLVVLDELDRVEDDNALSLLADTVKTLSDHTVSVTMMFVGVAESVESLIGEHESIVRNLVQVRMPRMSEVELSDILITGFGAADLTADEKTIFRIGRFSEGLPHFVHFLGQHAARNCVRDDRTIVTSDDLVRALGDALDTHSMLAEYQRATRSHQPDSLYEHVLLACAFAPRNELGYFRAGDVRAPLSAILGREVDIPNFQRHLNELSSEKRGGTLQKTGRPRHWQFRFYNPLLQPYVKIRAIARGMVDEPLHQQLQDAQEAGDAPNLYDRPTSPEPPVAQSLFDAEG